MPRNTRNQNPLMQAIANSRRSEYVRCVLRELIRKGMVSGVELRATVNNLHLQVPQKLAGECYKQVMTKPLNNARTLTHLLGRHSCDPLLRGFKHNIDRHNGDITHTIALPLEILEKAVVLQEQDAALFVWNLLQLLTDLQPVTDRTFLAGHCRRLLSYNVQAMVEAVHRHAEQWDFDPTLLVQSYNNLGRVGFPNIEPEFQSCRFCSQPRLFGFDEISPASPTNEASARDDPLPCDGNVSSVASPCSEDLEIDLLWDDNYPLSNIFDLNLDNLDFISVNL